MKKSSNTKKTNSNRSNTKNNSKSGNKNNKSGGANIIVGVLCIAAIGVVAYGVYDSSNQDNNQTQTQVEQELLKEQTINQELEKKVSDLENKVNELTTTIENLNDELNNLNDEDDTNDTTTNSEKEEDKEEVINANLKVHTVDANTFEDTVVGEVSHKGDIQKTLQNLANILSKEVFGDLKIVVLGIVDKDGKKIADIDLQNVDGIEYTWDGTFFQGSTGGGITSTSLEQTFLQRGYEGEWIDGIDVTFEGKDINYDHVYFLDTIYR